MSTRNPVVCSTSWTLVYDGTADGAFDGSIQSSTAATMRTGTVVPVVLTGFSTHDIPTPLTLSASEKLYVRSNSGNATIILSTNFYPPGSSGGGGGGNSSNVDAIFTVFIALNAFTDVSVGDTITHTQFVDTTSTPVTVASIWRNQTTDIDLSSAPSPSDIQLTGTGTPAVGTATQTTTIETGAFTIASGALAYSVANIGIVDGVFDGVAIGSGEIDSGGYVGKVYPALSGDATGTSIKVQRIA